ncbi:MULTISPECIES: hypothetical protein [unclassified Rhizobium]|uniref:competence protein CoiA family protein n=1 Tax=unclassified Rhizobium TaxID=2613769 RepID=UPI0016227B48|nr:MULTISPECIES: hypothetical protein [unclassified Rhizobium]MBB3521008.1 competence CoiA-like predicted nuclease [Rhizobium sp. BK456]MDR6664038.1 competence CoiA-like predicted nuclease [Rhizobium sp. 1399]
MGQIAYLTATGEELEAFSVTDSVWDALCQLPKGSITMPRTKWPATAKTSIKGLRFFAHYPGYTGALPKPESYAHTRLKIDVVKSLRSMGFKANIEVPGVSPDGEEWVADVLTETHDGRRVAFEIQLSSQHLRDFLSRSDRYVRSGVKVCWIISYEPVSGRLTKAIASANTGYYKEHGRFLADLQEIMPFRIILDSKDEYPEERLPLHFGRAQFHKAMEMEEALAGVMLDVPRWELPDWKWGDHREEIRRIT